jgi:uncharacterized protein
VDEKSRFRCSCHGRLRHSGWTVHQRNAAPLRSCAFPHGRCATAIERSRRPVAATRLRAVAQTLLDASPLCAIATTTPSGNAHINTAYFAWGQDWRLIWLSDPQARHSRNLADHASAAIAVFDSGQTWGDADRGIQLFGSAREATAARVDEARRLYERRFATYRSRDLGAYRFYELRPKRLKLFDEEALGAATFVTAKVGRGGQLAWERTEVYDARAARS